MHELLFLLANWTGSVLYRVTSFKLGKKKRPAMRKRRKEALFSSPSVEESGLLSSLLLHVMWEPRVLKEVSKLPPVQQRRGGHKGIPANKAPCQLQDAQHRDWLDIKDIPEWESSGSRCPLACPLQLVRKKKTTGETKKNERRENIIKSWQPGGTGEQVSVKPCHYSRGPAAESTLRFHRFSSIVSLRTWSAADHGEQDAAR